MNDRLLVFEFPLSERIRIFLRLEQLFQQVDHFMDGTCVWDSRAVITMLLDVLTIFSRNDLKSEILKELDRHSSVLARIARSHGVDQEKLELLRDELDQISRELYATNGKIGLSLMENELFKSISQRSSIPGGTCAFDLPEYHFWLEQDEQRRHQDLLEWTRPFMTIRKAIDLILRFIRQSSVPTQEIANSGFFQQSLDRSLPYQMLCVSIMASMPYFAEISGGKHRFTVRFMTADKNERPAQTTNDIQFLLTRCIF
ncbi:MAG: cell division protein ZapD [Methylococcaceae bacterium]|nr:cell division protein ZapD [Methylococcaceae bacterium]MCI0732691.1 cell division protein ZapD [Methylococcaceae bacterium]